MRVLIQRVSSASVIVDKKVIGEIGNGLLLFLGITEFDDNEDIEWLVKKVIQLRIFNDAGQKMNCSIGDINGSFLLISQFTLLAKTKKGNRPSYIRAAKPDKAIPFYEKFIDELKKTSGLKVESGSFGADMKVSLCNDGPVTIWLDSKNKE
jgi:D-tyrosyl-tRNA(Tyr) deacylase